MTDAPYLRFIPWRFFPLAGLLLIAPSIPASAEEGEALPSSHLHLAQVAYGTVAAEGPEELERMRVAKRAQAIGIDFFAPFYSVEGGRDTILFVMNRISEPVVVDLAARSGGEELPLGSYLIEPRQHVEVSLETALAGWEPEFNTGNLRLSLLGDEDTVQAWAVLSDPTGSTFEIPFKTPASVTAREFYAFWDVGTLGVRGPEPIVFQFLNTSDRELSVSLNSGPGMSPDSEELALRSGAAARWGGFGTSRLGRQGWLKVSHDGEAGDLVGIGLVGGGRPVGTVSLIPRGEAEYQRHYESLPLPVERFEGQERATPASGWINLMSLAAERQEVVVEALEAASGAVLARASVQAAPYEVVRVPLARLLSHGGRGSDPVRLRIEGEARGLVVQGMGVFRDGSAAELPIFGAYHGHGSGIYPLPDNQRFDVVTSIVNLGEEEAKIAVQATWAGGTFALRPITIPAGGSHEIDLDALAQAAPPDMSGRPLEAHRPAAVLQWTTMSGSTQLLGRTIVRPRAGQDRFGFNCFGCCHQWPSGTVVPGEVDFLPGQTPAFETGVVFDTCTGSMGPFPTGFSSLSSPWPFSWNGQVVGATDAADETLNFEGEERRTTSGCLDFLLRIFGFGRAITCRAHLNNWDPSKTCSSQTQSCSNCQTCCHQIYNWRICRRVNEQIATSERNACLGVCASDRC